MPIIIIFAVDYVLTTSFITLFKVRNIILFFLALLLSCTASAMRIPSNAVGKTEYEVRYKLKMLETKVATAVISLEKDKWEKQSAFHAKARIKASSIFRMFMGEEYVSDSYLTSAAMPLYCINPLKIKNRTGKREYYYHSGSHTIESVLTMEEEDPRSVVIQQKGTTLELLSLVIFARFHDFSSSGKMSLNVLMNGKSYPAVLHTEGIDNERFPGYETERIVLELTGRGLMEDGSGNQITLWRSTGSDRTVFGLEVPLSSGVMSVKKKKM